MIDVHASATFSRESNRFVNSVQLFLARRVAQVQKHRPLILLRELCILQHLGVWRRLIFETVRNSERTFVKILFDRSPAAGACADSHHESRDTVIDRMRHARKMRSEEHTSE